MKLAHDLLLYVLALCLLGSTDAFTRPSPKLDYVLRRQTRMHSIAGGPGGGGGRMADMLSKAQMKQDTMEDSEGWEPPPPDPEALARQEELRLQAFAEARADGFDPEDEESMKAWRRSLAQKAKDRMAASAAIDPVAPIRRVDDVAPVISAPVNSDKLFKGQEPEKYVPFDEVENAYEGDEEVIPVFTDGDARAQKMNVSAARPASCSGRRWCVT